VRNPFNVTHGLIVVTGQSKLIIFVYSFFRSALSSTNCQTVLHYLKPKLHPNSYLLAITLLLLELLEIFIPQS
jgi:predicted protein tyrosine phosphatase